MGLSGVIQSHGGSRSAAKARPSQPQRGVRQYGLNLATYLLESNSCNIELPALPSAMPMVLKSAQCQEQYYGKGSGAVSVAEHYEQNIMHISYGPRDTETRITAWLRLAAGRSQAATNERGLAVGGFASAGHRYSVLGNTMDASVDADSTHIQIAGTRTRCIFRRASREHNPRQDHPRRR